MGRRKRGWREKQESRDQAPESHGKDLVFFLESDGEPLEG